MTNAAVKVAGKPAPPPPKGGKKKKAKGALDLVVRRLYSAQEWLQRFQKQLGPHEDDAAAPLLRAREKTGLAYQALVDLGQAMPALRDSGWKPASTTISVGDTVQIKPKQIGRFLQGGAFTTVQLARLSVLSVHGKHAKITLADGTLIGLYPLGYFKPAPPALQPK